MTHPDDEIVAAVDVDHLDDRPDDLHHVAVVDDGDELRARPFTDDDRIPGYVEIDVDLIDYDAVCRHVEQETDFDRRITFTVLPVWTPDGTGPVGPSTYR